MDIFELLFYLLISGGVAYLIYTSRNFNHSNDKNKPQYYKISDYEFGRKVIKIFSGINTKINTDQRNIVKEESGEDLIIDSQNLKKIILSELKISLKSVRGLNCLSKQLLKSYYISILR